MIYFPKAKINIGLRITERRPDGYHNIETVFYPIGLTDILEIVPSNHDHYFYDGIAMPPSSKKNLVEQAVDLLRKHFHIPAIDLYLKKGIPAQAGLGGGSSDASAVLLILNKIFDLNINTDQLMKFASELGADCPFFIQKKPVYATGTGNIFKPIDLNIGGYYLVIIKPDVAVSTKEAYESITPKQSSISLTELLKTPVASWKETIINDFEEPIFLKYPILRKLKEQLYQLGAVYAAMSGSGSALYGLFLEKPKLPDELNNYFVHIHKLESY